MPSPTSVPVEVVSVGKLHKETAKDVSFSGIYIESSDFHKYELEQDLIIAFASKDGKAYTLEGKIVRKDTSGAGIEFKEELICDALKHVSEWQQTKK